MHRHSPGTREPIAIVGVSCRLPGGIGGLDDLWVALTEERDLISQVPADRFDTGRFVEPSLPRLGKSYTAAGGFLTAIDAFDAAYFGISPKEADYIDPQHRLLLELTAEALDDAAIDPASLAGGDTAVYVGISDTSYPGLQQPREVSPYTMAGAASSIAANRVSHAFDFRGPSMAVDTACSSSLVALDSACRVLWEGISASAVCGGVNLLLNPLHYLGFSSASMLSRRGRCAAFSADADGFVRAEGGGVVVLKSLAGALADGDRVHGVILGSATNCDGRTVGLSLPAPRMQEKLLREVYQQARVGPDELVYFEAHGTGTPAGDPAEATAIGRALGVRRIVGDLPIGSVKTNIGHLEPASGIAGLCKALLVLKHRTVPPSLHGENPNPEINFAGLGLSLATTKREVPAVERPVVGVNSFGFGGANAHVILTGAPAPVPSQPRRSGGGDSAASVLPVVASAGTPEGLRQAVADLSRHCALGGPFYDVAYTSWRRRLHKHRAVVLAPTAEEAARKLSGLYEETAPERPGDGQDGGSSASAGAVAQAVERGRVAFVFSGNGSQWAGMGGDLFDRDPVFRRAVEEVDLALTDMLGWSVAAAFRQEPAQWRLQATEFAQPLLFALQVGLLACLRSRGVQPSMVFGHSVGEVGAAFAAGALSLAEAARVIAVRSMAQAPLAGGGRMAAVGLGERAARDVLAGHGGGLEIAAVNSPDGVTVAGPAGALAALGRRLEHRGVFFRDLGLPYAFHSAAMDAARDGLLKALHGLEPTGAAVVFYSTVSGTQLTGGELDAAYWWDNVRRPVRFARASQLAVADGADILVEVGPHPVLRTYLRRNAEHERSGHIAVLSTLRRGADGPGALSRTEAELLATGARMERSRYFPRRGHVQRLPSYPWQRQRHWVGTPASWVRTSGSGVVEHPLLGERLPAPHPLWQGTIEPALVPWLSDHRIQGTVLMPAAGYVEMALAAGRCLADGPVESDRILISSGLALPWEDVTATRLQIALRPDDGTVTITSTDEHTDAPRTHATARVRALKRSRPAPLDVPSLRARCPEHVEGGDYYRLRARAGLEYGPAFQVLTALDVGRGEVLAVYRHDAPADAYVIHPALLDGALQAGVQLLARELADGHGYLPSSMGAVRLWRAPATTGVIGVREKSRTAEEVCWNLVLADDDGTVAVEVEDCRLRRLPTPHRAPLTTHHTVLRAAPHHREPRAPSPLPLPSVLLAEARPHIERLRAHWREQHHTQAVTELTTFAARHHANALARMLPRPAEPFGPADLEAAGLPAGHRAWAHGMLTLMAHHGTAVRLAGEQWQLTGREWDTRTPARRCLALCPDFAAAVALAAAGEGHWSAPSPAVSTTADHRAVCPVRRVHHRLARTLLRRAVQAWPAGRALRVLEVGAGCGSLTAALLPALPPERTRYCFTDRSTAGFAAAQARFIAHDFLDYRVFDPDCDPAGQGLCPRTFDLIVTDGCLLTARDPQAAARHLAGLLAPGGHLLSIESHDTVLSSALDPPTPAGATAPSGDERRPGHLPWPSLLAGCGFTEVCPTSVGEGVVLLAATPLSPEVPLPPACPEPPDTDSAAATDAVFVLVVDDPDQAPLAHAVQKALPPSAHARTADLVTSGSEVWESLLTAACEQVPAASGTVNIVLFTGVADTAQPDAIAARACRSVAHMAALAAAWERRRDVHRAVRLWLVTRPHGALPALTSLADPADGAAWGAARTLANEHPDLGCRRVSLARTGRLGADAGRLVRELLCPQDEDEVVLTPDDRFVPREREGFSAAHTPAGTPIGLRVHDTGLAYRLAWSRIQPPGPGADEVSIQVRAAGLNYRDVMQCAGLLPTEMIEGTPSERGPGIECAGVVTAVGPGVTRFAPGDRVVAIAPASLATHCVARAHCVMPLPDYYSYAQGATLVIAFLTVHYGLGHLARLRPGETVLVHGAAGAVGLAALRFAERNGARLIATAGSDLKRSFLRALGVPHVLDSRTLEFADQVREITAGRGVDVVLNSLAGEAIPRSLELLRPGGRFIELGKRDIYENKPLSLRPFDNNIGFFGMDISALLEEPEFCTQLAAEVHEQALESEYRGLPHVAFPAARVDEAFRLLQHSRHIGKVVITFDPQDELPAAEPSPARPRLDTDGAYLITGGTSGFGAASATWLAGLGALRLVLVSRRGAAAPEVPALLTALSRRGVHATAHAVDVTDLPSMRRLIEDVEAEGHRLRGVVHAAMHVDDAPLCELSEERISAVMAPKVTGAAVLDALTRDRDCALFLCYSSGTALLGNIKQAPYTAANAFLEALVRQRRQHGRAGLAVAWGALAETGYVVRNQLARSLAQAGIELLTPQEAFSAAEVLLDRQADVVGVGRYQWSRMGALLRQASAPRLAGLIPADSHAGDFSREQFIRELKDLPADTALARLVRELTTVTAEILRMDTGDLDPYRRLDAYGMDSLLGTQLLAALQRRFAVEIPPMELLGSNGTIAGFARVLHLRLGLARPEGPGTVAGRAVRAVTEADFDPLEEAVV